MYPKNVIGNHRCVLNTLELIVVRLMLNPDLALILQPSLRDFGDGDQSRYPPMNREGYYRPSLREDLRSEANDFVG